MRRSKGSAGVEAAGSGGWSSGFEGGLAEQSLGVALDEQQRQCFSAGQRCVARRGWERLEWVGPVVL